MDAERFRDSIAGRLVQAWQDGASYWAFAPNPLPPPLALDPQLFLALSEADRALGELAGLGRTMPNPNLLIGPFIRREAVLSSKIEGTQTDIADLYAYEAGQFYLPGMRPSPPESDLQEVLNYVEALHYGLQRLNSLPISQRLFRELHERLMRGVRGHTAAPGEFRQHQNWIGRPNDRLDQARFVPPPVAEMQQCLADLERYIHSDDPLPPLVRIGLIHYQFEAIHPFRDGNGRIGRLLISLLLTNWNLLPQPLLYLSAFFERNRADYYDLLFAVSERAAWNEWLAFFLRGVAEQSRDAIRRAKQLQDIQQQWRQQLTQARSSALLLHLADSLFEMPILTIPQARKLLNVTYHSAQRTVEKLVKSGILRQAGEPSYGKLFMADAILRTLEGA
jgi:Fic family protein